MILKDYAPDSCSARPDLPGDKRDSLVYALELTPSDKHGGRSVQTGNVVLQDLTPLPQPVASRQKNAGLVTIAVSSCYKSQ